MRKFMLEYVKIIALVVMALVGMVAVVIAFVTMKEIIMNKDDLRVKLAFANIARHNNCNVYLAADTPETQSTSGDFADKDPNLLSTFAYALAATMLCFPLGVLSIRNTYKVGLAIKYGKKSTALKHNDFVRNLFSTSLVAGVLFWSIAILLATVQLVILR